MPYLLLVEDEVMVSDAVVELLTDDGHQVEMAESAESAIELLKGMSPLPDAILSDIRLPGMSGIEFLEVVRKSPEWRDIPFICLSASIPPEKEGLLAAQIDVTFIPKPFEIDAFLQTVAKVAGK